VVEERGREEGSCGGYRFTDFLDTYQAYHPLPTFYMSIKQHIHGFVKTIRGNYKYWQRYDDIWWCSS
jgi:hypothetical protein